MPRPIHRATGPARPAVDTPVVGVAPARSACGTVTPTVTVTHSSNDSTRFTRTKCLDPPGRPPPTPALPFGFACTRSPTAFSSSPAAWFAG